MSNKKMILMAVALVAVIAVLAGVYYLTRPETQTGRKTVTVTVVHGDGSEKVFTYHTDEEYLGALLVKEGLVIGEDGKYDTIDGEEAVYADNGAWWAFYAGEEMANQGMDTTPIADGDSFRLVYTIGFVG